MKPEELLEALLALDPHVRKVGVIRSLESQPMMKTRPGLVEVLLDKEDKLKIIFSIVVDSFKQFERESGVGPLNLTAIYYRDLYFFLFPYDGYVVGVSCDPGPMDEITRKIAEFIKAMKGKDLITPPPEKVVQTLEV